MAGQGVRPSQFITTYGPGAIVESQEGPLVLAAVDMAGLDRYFRGRRWPEIGHARMSAGLLGGASIFRVPSNAELNVPDEEPTYRGFRFPDWSYCAAHQKIYYLAPGARLGCPDCGNRPPDALESKAWQEAIRFVRACPRGHMDDVDWHAVIHQTPGCRSDSYQWIGAGAALRNVRVICPRCGNSANLGAAYARDWRCSGRLPERGGQRPRNCDAPSRISQRGAANLRVPTVLSALTIPPASTALHRLLEVTPVRAVLMTQQIGSKAQLMTSVRQLASGGLIRSGLPTELDQYDEARILMAVKDIQTLSGPQSLLDFRLAEFRALRRAATYGEPPVPAAAPGGPARFEVIQHHVRTVRTPRGLALRVTPVERLEVVLVLRGFIRQISVNPPRDPDEVTCSFQADGNGWYPGIELFGEGVFVDFPDGLDMPLAGPAYTSPIAADWMTDFRSRRAELDENHPCFVWWHSVAHRLITALALDSGFGAASIRERVYCQTDASGRAEGGILLYSTQPGGDGTLGGLIAMVPHFERVLERAFADLDTCSNDPLCWENMKRPGSTLGSACYSCLFISETSCEHRNHYLDRRVVQEFPA